MPVLNAVGLLGVFVRSRCRRPFAAGITHAGRFIYIGYFDTAEEAARAYDAKAIALRGEFARTNFAREGVR